MRPKKVSLPKNEVERLRDKNAVLQEVHVQDAAALGARQLRELPPRKQSEGADPRLRALVVIASSDGFAQAQRTPSRKSLRDFSPPSPMAALQL